MGRRLQILIPDHFFFFLVWFYLAISQSWLFSPQNFFCIYHKNYVFLSIFIFTNLLFYVLFLNYFLFLFYYFFFNAPECMFYYCALKIIASAHTCLLHTIPHPFWHAILPAIEVHLAGFRFKNLGHSGMNEGVPASIC